MELDEYFWVISALANVQMALPRNAHEYHFIPTNLQSQTSLFRRLIEHSRIIFIALVALILIALSSRTLLLNPRTRDQLTAGLIPSDCSSEEATLYLIGNEGEAKCMDGSSPAYYYRKGREPSKWHIHFEGGGWCYDLKTCKERSYGRLGSSDSYPSCMINDLKDYLSNDEAENPLMAGWNHVLVKYCDGASYAGDAVRSFEVDFNSYSVVTQ